MSHVYPTIISLPLADGTRFGVVSTYTESQSKAVIALVFISCVSLVATVGLLCAIAMSAFNTRGVKGHDMFVRSHVAFYFISLLLGDILQAIGSIMNAAWVQNKAVVFGSFCTAQGSIKHTADVAIAIWSLIIAIRVFVDLFLRVEVQNYAMWLVMISQWSLIGTIVIAGPAVVKTQYHGPFYGISDEWCWISPNYRVQRIVLDYMVMFLSVLFAFILYSIMYLTLRGIVRARAPSTSIVSTNLKRYEKYEYRLARQMILFPIAYTIMTFPIALCRFLELSGHRVSFSANIFSDFIYLMSGLVHVIIFASMRRILPPRSVLPKFLIISNPTAAPVVEREYDDYYGDAAAKQWNNDDVEKGAHAATLPPRGVTKLAEDPDDTFAYPAFPPNDVTIIKHVHSPDSDPELASAYSSPHLTPRTLSPMPIDYVDGSVLAEEEASSPGSARTQDEAWLEHEQDEVVLAPPNLRTEEELEVPMSANSIFGYYEHS